MPARLPANSWVTYLDVGYSVQCGHYQKKLGSGGPFYQPSLLWQREWRHRLRHCREEVLNQPEAATLQTRDDAVLWLLWSHNQVNARIAGVHLDAWFPDLHAIAITVQGFLLIATPSPVYPAYPIRPTYCKYPKP